MPIKVIHLPLVIANQAVTLSKYLKRIGVDSKTISYFRTWLGYKGDINLDLDSLPPPERNRRLDTFVTQFLKSDAKEYDIFHFHFFDTLATGASFGGWKVQPERKPYWDLQVLKEMGKKIILHNWGSDVRNNSKITYYQLMFEHPGLKLPYPPLNRKDQYFKVWESAQFADAVLCGDSETLKHVPYGITLPMVLDVETLEEVESRVPADHGCISILHAPSNKAIKGSKYIVEILDRLRQCYPGQVEIRLVHGVPYEEALNLYRGCGIAVDQISIGFGLFALEAMYFGRPVVCAFWEKEYVEDDPKRKAPILPVDNQKILYERITEFIKEPFRLKGESPKGYVLDHFSGEIVSQQYKELYEKLLANEPISSFSSQRWMREFNRLIKGEKVDVDDYYPRVTDLLLSQKNIVTLLGEVENGLGLGHDAELLAKYLFALERIGEDRRAQDLRSRQGQILRTEAYEHHYARAKALYEYGEVRPETNLRRCLLPNTDGHTTGDKSSFDQCSTSPCRPTSIQPGSEDRGDVSPVSNSSKEVSATEGNKVTMTSQRVTVLISTYNRPAFLKEAIQSVIDQKMTDWELLVINDGGVDVGYVIQEFQDERILYFNDDVNKGLAARLNFGLKKARGKYIAYLGDDDLWYDNHLAVLSKVLDENPGIGAVYSDLYGVQCIKDEVSGKRFPLHKFIQASREYNRDAMFCFNHTLHVSLMHRKDLALRAGGYDESIKVLIDWNMTRKLSFYTDFKHVPKLTGEYYMPIKDPDRISNRERQDHEGYKHNLRKIMADLPPEPWTKVDRIAIIFPVIQWDDSITAILTDLADRLFYPVRFVLVNNDVTKDDKACRKALGKIGELKNFSIHTPLRPLKELEAYRFGAEKTRVDYVYLLTKNVDTRLEMRLLTARYFFKRKHCEGIKWNVEQEKEGPFDLLMKRDLFLRRSAPGNGKMDVTLDIVPRLPPDSLRCDFFCQKAKEEQEAGNHESAYQFFKEAEAVKQGGAGEQYLIDLYARICFDLGRYDEAEQKCRELIEKGYGADNWIRLGKILQTKGEYEKAIRAFQNGLQEIGLKDLDLKSSVFPIMAPLDFGSFSAFIGLGECLLETGNLIESSKALHRAGRLKANSHRPFLGFGKLFLKANDLDQAEEALLAASKMKEEAETYRLLGHLYERKERWETAFDHYVKAFKVDPKLHENTRPLYQLGKALNKWEEMKVIFEESWQCHPEALPVRQCLSDICNHLKHHHRAEILESGPSGGLEESNRISNHSLLIGDAL